MKFNIGDIIEFEEREFIIKAEIIKVDDMERLGLAETPLACIWFHYKIVDVRARENIIGKTNAFQGTSQIYETAKVVG